MATNIDPIFWVLSLTFSLNSSIFGDCQGFLQMFYKNNVMTYFELYEKKIFMTKWPIRFKNIQTTGVTSEVKEWLCMWPLSKRHKLKHTNHIWLTSD